MKTYRVVVTDDAKADLKRYRDYILKNFKNPQPARAVILDFRETRIKLGTIATSISLFPGGKSAGFYFSPISSAFIIRSFSFSQAFDTTM